MCFVFYMSHGSYTLIAVDSTAGNNLENTPNTDSDKDLMIPEHAVSAVTNNDLHMIFCSTSRAMNNNTMRSSFGDTDEDNQSSDSSETPMEDYNKRILEVLSEGMDEIYFDDIRSGDESFIKIISRSSSPMPSKSEDGVSEDEGEDTVDYSHCM